MRADFDDVFTGVGMRARRTTSPPPDRRRSIGRIDQPREGGMPGSSAGACSNAVATATAAGPEMRITPMPPPAGVAIATMVSSGAKPAACLRG
jgi:hypothetical protein